VAWDIVRIAEAVAFVASEGSALIKGETFFVFKRHLVVIKDLSTLNLGLLSGGDLAQNLGGRKIFLMTFFSR